MLKAIVSYSKKIPVPDSEFSSQGYSLSLETEIPETDLGAIQAKLHQTFQLVKDQVEHELASGNGNGNGHAAKPSDTGAQPANRPATGDKASNKQIKFITDLAGQKNIPPSELNAEIKKRFNVDGLYDLSSKQASELLDTLKRGKAA